MTINNKAINLSSILFIIYLLILPTFGKVIDIRESLIFYCITPFLFFNALQNYPQNYFRPSGLQMLTHLSLIALFFMSTVFSINIGTSVYPFLNFVTIILIFNLYPYYLKNIKDLYIPIIVFGVFYSIIHIASYFHLIILPNAIYLDNFILQIWGHSYLGGYLIFPIIILLSLINSKNIKYTLPTLLLISTSLVLTNYRSAIFATICGIFFLSINSRLLKIIKISLLGILFIFLLYIFYRSSIPSLNTKKTFDGSRFEYWHQALIGFSHSPIIGNGATSFDYFNHLYRSNISSSSLYARNSILQFLVDHGIIFTLIIITYIFTGLYYQYKTNNLLFCLGIAAVINSQFDASWSSPGILILSLIFIFYRHPLFYKSDNSIIKWASIYLGILSIFIIICFLCDTVSSYFLAKKQFQLSLKFNPFNSDAIFNNQKIDQNLALKYFGNRPATMRQLIKQIPLPASEQFYYKLFELDPKESIAEYKILLSYYLQTKQTDKFDKLAIQMNNQYLFSDLSIKDTIPIAKILYLQAINEWKSKLPNKSINNLEIALKYSTGWSHFYIELANTYWHNGEKDKAIQLLEKDCGNNISPAAHCFEYLKTHSNNFLQPGSPEIMQAINDIVY